MTPNFARTAIVTSSAVAVALLVAGFSTANRSANLASTDAFAWIGTIPWVGAAQPAPELHYGPAMKLGNGTVRTYVRVDPKRDSVPLEIGVAMSEAAMEGLPAPVPLKPEEMHREPNPNMHMWVLELPARNPTPYKFVQFGWNPAGHEPQGVYDKPHFDFHFWTVPEHVMHSIVPTDPRYGDKAGSYPAEDQRMPFYLDAATAAKVPAAQMSVPMMGMHWLDVRSPELQGLTGHPENFKPFTTTFLHGSWDGQFIFHEPMITRDYIMAKRNASDPAVRDEVIRVPTAKRYQPAGHYPAAYRIAWDGKAKEYRVALTEMAWRE
jgi:Domain of unknown function (DUF5602)